MPLTWQAKRSAFVRNSIKARRRTYLRTVRHPSPQKRELLRTCKWCQLEQMHAHGGKSFPVRLDQFRQEGGSPCTDAADGERSGLATGGAPGDLFGKLRMSQNFLCLG